MSSIGDLWIFYNTRFFDGFAILWGYWSISAGLSSWRPWAIFYICKLAPPLWRNPFSSISSEICMTVWQIWCLDRCFHGQGIRLRHGNSVYMYSFIYTRIVPRTVLHIDLQPPSPQCTAHEMMMRNDDGYFPAMVTFHKVWTVASLMEYDIRE